MHVLVTADTLGGVWTYTRELVTGLVSRGHRVTLVSFGDIPSLEQAAWMTALPELDFRPTAFRLEWMQDSEKDIAESAEFLLAVIREVKPDLLHLGQFCFGDLPCDVPRVVVAHSDVVTWWLAVHRTMPPDGAWMRTYRARVLRGVAGATALVAPSKWMLQAFTEVHGKPRMQSVIYNGRTPGLFNPYTPKQSMALSVGRIWDVGKNSALLNKIASSLPVFLAGSDRDPADRSLDDETPCIPLHDGVYFQGKQTEEQLRQLYSRASIYVATSQYEPFGLAPLEAAFSKCAIIASDIPSLREIWGEAACYFKNNDADSLQETLQRLHEDKEALADLGARAYQRAMGRYTSQRMVEEYLQLYRTLSKTGALAA